MRYFRSCPIPPNAGLFVLGNVREGDFRGVLDLPAAAIPGPDTLTYALFRLLTCHYLLAKLISWAMFSARGWPEVLWQLTQWAGFGKGSGEAQVPR